ncbi:hypothetical protein SDC9_66497 [bioreactor metagenome]|uniref:Uncharacterized protein n=1 Tax=bioreactor metagenome TaxID=1076179 RepID=A0A644XV32_9ZZZZ
MDPPQFAIEGVHKCHQLIGLIAQLLRIITSESDLDRVFGNLIIHLFETQISLWKIIRVFFGIFFQNFFRCTV